jgi:hypothetical protein
LKPTISSTRGASSLADRIAEGPQDRRRREDERHHQLVATQLAERRELTTQEALAWSSFDAVGSGVVPEHAVDDRQHEDDEGQGEQRVGQEAHLDAELVLDEAAEDRVGARADLGADAADVRGVGDGEHDRRAELTHRAADRLLELAEQRHADGHHHHGGRGVADPQGERGGRDDHAREQSLRLGADREHDAERDAFVQAALLHRGADRHAAEEHEDVGVDVGLGRSAEAAREAAVVHAEQRKEDERRTGRPGDRQSLGEPPDRHERGHARREGGAAAVAGYVVEARGHEGERREREEAQGEADEPARAALLGQAELLAHGADDPTSRAAASTRKRVLRLCVSAIERAALGVAPRASACSGACLPT